MLIACILGTVFGLFIIRLLLLLKNIRSHQEGDGYRQFEEPRTTGSVHSTTVRTMVILGSGGHTMEMMQLVQKLGPKYRPLHYVVAKTDSHSEKKVHRLHSEKSSARKYTIHQIARSREVKQSWLTSIITTLYASLYSFPLVFRVRPQLVLCNGPGTCVPICCAAFCLKLLGWDSSVIYVESLCRVETLSLTGQILYHFADQIFVQWNELKQKYPRTCYLGRLS